MHAQTVTVASVSSVTSSTLALEVLALQWDTLGRGVAVMVPGVAGVDQLRPCWLNYREKDGFNHRGTQVFARAVSWSQYHLVTRPEQPRDSAALQNVLK